MLVLIICSSNMIKAQDTLSMRTGVNILVKVIEIGTTEVKYKKQDNLKINQPILKPKIEKSDEKVKDPAPEEEIVKDIMAIMNVYVAKMNGLRKYKKNIDN